MLPLYLTGDSMSNFPFLRNSLVALSMLPAWLLANQHFIKSIQTTNLLQCTKSLPHTLYLPVISLFQSRQCSKSILNDYKIFHGFVNMLP